jgi:UDP-3-O-[3-hydroxymyristoyl] glucosamine N-acyltransferase
MKLNHPITLKEIAALIHCEFVGDANHEITGINEIHVVEPGDIVFVDHPKYYDKALHSKATTILIDKKVDCPPGKGLLISDDPCRDFNFLNKHFRPEERQHNAHGTHVNIDPTAYLYPGVTVGNHVNIGAGSVIYPGVVIRDYSIIGENVIIQANSVIGGDAFYYKKRGETYDKMYSCGRVVIHNQVEIGCNCTIDRGLTGDTVIGEGTKIDNLVHVGHDTVIGRHCLFAAQVGIAGCVVIEDNVTLWGQVGVRSDITIGKGAIVLAQSGIAGSLDGGKTYFGSPAEETRTKYKETAALKIMAGEYLKNRGK